MQHNNCEAVLLHLFLLLKKLERIDNFVTDRYSLIADLCGYAERFVFDLLRKIFLLFGFSISPEFSIPFVTETFILKQLQSLKTDKATGLDGLSAKYLKLSAQVISKPLTAILNLSIQSSSYPNALKKAKVTPIFKKGSKADVNN